MSPPADFPALLREALAAAGDASLLQPFPLRALEMPEAVIRYVSPGRLADVLRPARGLAAAGFGRGGWSLRREVDIGDLGVSLQTARLYAAPAFPGYLRSLTMGSTHLRRVLGAMTLAPVVRVAAPTIHLLHPNAFVYGHFLMEALLKLPYLPAAAPDGTPLPVFVPHGFPAFVRSRLAELLPPERLVFGAPGIVHLFTAALTPHVSPSYFLTAVQADWCDGIGAAPEPSTPRPELQPPEPGQPEPEPTLPRHIFVRRKGGAGFRTLVNLDALEALFVAAGFATVYPETMTLAEQARLFRGAAVVAGEYSSALHNMIFSPAGTRAIVFNCINGVQSAIAMSRGHALHVLAPAGGAPFVNDTAGPHVRYEIDLDEARQVIGLALA